MGKVMKARLSISTFLLQFISHSNLRLDDPSQQALENWHYELTCENRPLCPLYSVVFHFPTAPQGRAFVRRWREDPLLTGITPLGVTSLFPTPINISGSFTKYVLNPEYRGNRPI
jgi:hypothetical protein